MYVTVNLGGKDREIKYRILSRGGLGWETEWEFTNLTDALDMAGLITEKDEEDINTAIIIAEGNAS